jgi:hypothetical protein
VQALLGCGVSELNVPSYVVGGKRRRVLTIEPGHVEAAVQLRPGHGCRGYCLAVTFNDRHNEKVLGVLSPWK